MGFIAVDVIATFNTDGQIKPLYIRLENEEGLQETCQIVKYCNMSQVNREEQVFGGYTTLLDRLKYQCETLIGDKKIYFCLWYFVGECLWYMEK